MTYKSTDEILETPVTWGNIEDHLRSSLKTEAKFGSNMGVVDIGDGTGYASRCGLITCDWVGAGQDEKLPTKVIVKIPSILPMRRLNEALPKEQRMFDSEEAWTKLEGTVSQVHNIEIASYQFLGEFESLEVPKMFFGYRMEPGAEINGQLCMSFVDNTDMMNYHKAHTVEQLRQVAKALGAIQACSINKEPTSPEFLKDVFSEFAATVTKEVYCNVFKMLLLFDPSERVVKMVEEIEKILPEYYGSNLPSTIHKQLNYKPVLVNGDMRTENVLINKDTGDLAALIDWQCTHLGVGVEDLIRVTVFALPAKERRESKDELLTLMYNTMVENIHGAEPPYTLEQLSEVYDLLFPHCSLYFATSAPILMKTLMEKPGIPEEIKQKCLAIQLDKVLGAVEDIVEYDKLNRKSPRTLEFRQQIDQ
ncbi:hypothetical protein PFISCL1PPCAC_20325 [Pristionchus fissidentatus]|uniref:CHK kinase-like domain-containing protein n=1 Tax=Pristionchus fissidentatus TaxID=1538716 RepID=A0AAV5WBW0_9BILA|nr:hypothetical protein PFISCL1PPCAC_20325 [Pristionchus fissidentatus]